MSYPFEGDPSAYQLRLYDGGPDYESWLWQIQRAAFRRKVWDYAVCAYEIPPLPAKHAPMPIHLDYLRHRAGDGEMRQFFLANVSRPIQEHIKDLSTSKVMLQQLNRMYGAMAFIRRENQFYSFKKDPNHSIPDYLRALAIGFDRLRAISPRVVARDTFKYQFVRGLPSEWSLFGKLVLNHIDRLKTKEFFNVFVQEETNRLLNGVIRPPPRKPSHHPMKTFRDPIQGLVVRSRPSRQLVEPPRFLIPPGNSIMPMQNAPSSNPMAVVYNTGGPLDYFSMNELISSPQPSVSFASQSPQNEPSLLSGDEDGYESPKSLTSEASTLKAPYDSCEDRMKAPDHSEESMKILDQLQEATEEDVEDAVEAPDHLEQPVKALNLREENLPTPGLKSPSKHQSLSRDECKLQFTPENGSNFQIDSRNTSRIISRSLSNLQISSKNRSKPRSILWNRTKPQRPRKNQPSLRSIVRTRSNLLLLRRNRSKL